MNNLLRLIGNRLLWLPIMVFGVTVLVFFLMSLSPIDQAYSALGENASPEQLAAYRTQHGLDDPVVVQYCNYMAGFFHGDLGPFGPAQAASQRRCLSRCSWGSSASSSRSSRARSWASSRRSIAIVGLTRSSASSRSPASQRRRSGSPCCSSFCSLPRCTCCPHPARFPR